VGHVGDPDTEFIGAICLIMNPQSKGSVRLHSKIPSAAPLIDPSFLSHSFDRRVLIEGMKVTKRLLSAPVYAEKTLRTYMPTDDSDEAIWVRTEGSRLRGESADQVITGAHPNQYCELVAHVGDSEDGPKRC